MHITNIGGLGLGTGIIATDKTDGTVYHARNLDFTPAPYDTCLFCERYVCVRVCV